MSDWIDVAVKGEIPEGGFREIYVDDIRVAVFNLAGEYYAIDAICSHDYGILTEGTVDGNEIECPLHGARFDIRTGKVTAPPAYEAVHTYPLRIQGDTIQISDNRMKD